MVSFTLRLPFPDDTTTPPPRYPLGNWLGGSQSRSERGGEKIPAPVGK